MTTSNRAYHLFLTACSKYVFAVTGALFLSTTAVSQELKRVSFSPSEAGVLISIEFSSQAPEEFLTYCIMQNDNPILVAEFSDVKLTGDLFTNTTRPVSHIQVVQDTMESRSNIQTLFYLEKNIPYQYRWQDTTFELELICKKTAPVAKKISYLLDITCSLQKDSSVTIAFIFDTLAADNTFSLSADRQDIIARFYNAESAEDEIPGNLPPPIHQILLNQGTTGDQIPYSKFHITFLREIDFITKPNNNTMEIIIKNENETIIAGKTDPPVKNIAAVTNANGEPIPMQKRKSSKKWTYIGVGSGVAVGGVILGVILNKKKGSGSSEDDGIPDIDVTIPD